MNMQNRHKSKGAESTNTALYNGRKTTLQNEAASKKKALKQMETEAQKLDV
jgi:hypothetical protein